MKRSLLLLLALPLIAACGESENHAHEPGDEHGDVAAAAGTFAVPTSGSVHFVSPADGATVTSPFKVEFGVTGVTVAAASTYEPNTGHHHILVDSGPMELGIVIPANDTNIHFGGGQTETELTLAPGEHTLTMQLADGIHRSYGEAFAATITVTVE